MKALNPNTGNFEEVYVKAFDGSPIGSIFPYAGSTAPTGFLICDGSAISRTSYAELFAVIGTTYGTGDGSTTFNIPDYRGKVPVGYDSTQTDFDTLGETGGEKTHTLTTQEMPSHAHSSVSIYYGATGGGNHYMINTDGVTNASTTHSVGYTSNAGGGQAHNNLQPYLVVNYIIKATQTVPLNSAVVNAQSNSTTDTYSCNFINTTYNNYIIEESTSGNWRYRKWSNGTAECWKTITGSVSVTTQWGNGLYYGTISSQNFPSSLFKETPVVSYQNLAGTSLICMNSGAASITSTGSIQVARGTSNANASYSIGIFAIGTWK